MKIRKHLKKGFTLVELVVVIAIIAILTGVGVAVYTGITNKAKITADSEIISQLNLQLKTKKAGTEGSNANCYEAYLDGMEIGFDLAKMKPQSGGYYVWDQEKDLFAVVDGNGSLTAGDKDYKVPALKHKLWKFVASTSETSEYSQFLTSKNAVESSVTVESGFDSGLNENVKAINYVNDSTTEKDVIIRTNSYDTILTINAPAHTVKHFDKANKINVEAVAMHSYHEFGDVLGNINLTAGNVVVEEGCKASAVVIDMTAAELATVTTLSADNSKAPEVPIILNTSETLWGANPHNDLIDPEKNNIIYANFGGGTLPENFDTLSEAEKEAAIEAASASVKDYGALVDDVGYDTFKTAIDNVTKAGQTIRLLKDYKYAASPSYVYTNKASYTIDLNGHTLDMNDSGYGLYILNGQTVTLNDSEGTGSLKNRQCVVYMVDGANLIINGGHIGGVDKDQATIYGYGNVTVNGGIIDEAIYYTYGGYYGVMVGNYTNDNTPASFIMNGGIVNGGITINGQDEEKNLIEITGGELNGGAYLAGNCIANISGGTISGASAIYTKSGTWNISGGTFIGTETEHCDFIHGNSGASLTGGAFVFEACGYPAGDPVLNITGGEFIVNSEGSYGIEIYHYQGHTVEVKALKDFKGTTHTFEVE